nr:hypothetical protein [uncultured Hyphomonas sp.]
MTKKTHREVKEPRISGRYLADYMGASEQARRTIIRACKFRPIARIIQHEKARQAIVRGIVSGRLSCEYIAGRADRIRELIADDDFDQSVLDNNADYLDHFSKFADDLDLPDVEFQNASPPSRITVNGVTITSDIVFRSQRLTRTNKVRIGAGTLRYAKGKPLNEEVANWQAAFLFGFLRNTTDPEEVEPENKQCIVIDAQTGVVHSAPTNAVSRYNNMEAACATIAERWANIAPPPNAVF